MARSHLQKYIADFTSAQSKNKTSRLWEYGHGQQLEQVCWLFQKMYFIIGFKLVCVFSDCFTHYCY